MLNVIFTTEILIFQQKRPTVTLYITKFAVFYYVYFN